MRVPQLLGAGLGYGIRNNTQKVVSNDNPYVAGFNNGLKADTVSFTSTAKYLKKYVTLPDEIKKNLTPTDAIDMFKQMEYIAAGSAKAKRVGQGVYSNVYQNPWLSDYYLLILKDTNYDKQIIYSSKELGDAVWVDDDDVRIQIIKKCA